MKIIFKKNNNLNYQKKHTKKYEKKYILLNKLFEFDKKYAYQLLYELYASVEKLQMGLVIKT